MSSFQIIVGSMLGTTEYVGEACEEQLNTLNHQATIHLNPNFDLILKTSIEQKNNSKKQQKSIWLICTSTHGAGDFPDNIKPFVEDLNNCAQDLSSIEFMIIALGDTSYDTYCKAGFDMEKSLISKGCIKKIETYTIDMSADLDPEDRAQTWLTENNDLL